MPKPVSTRQLILINFAFSVICFCPWQQASAAPSKSSGSKAPVNQNASAPTYTKLPTPLEPKEAAQQQQIIASYSATLRQNPNDVKILLQRANGYLRVRDWQHAGQDCEQLFKLKTKDKDAGEIAYQLVQAYNNDLDEENALHFSDLAIRAFPNQSRLYCERGELLHGMGRNKEGIADETKAIAVDPKYGHAYFARGEIKASTGDFAGAIIDFETSAPFMKNPYVAYLRAGQCYEVLKDWKNAAIIYGKIGPLKFIDVTDRLKARVHHGNALKELGDKEGALKDFSFVVDAPRERTMKFERNTQANEQSEALHGRALIFTAQKKYDLAVKDYTRLISNEAEWGAQTPKWYLERAKLYRQMGKPDLASRDEDVAKHMAPTKH